MKDINPTSPFFLMQTNNPACIRQDFPHVDSLIGIKLTNNTEYLWFVDIGFGFLAAYELIFRIHREKHRLFDIIEHWLELNRTSYKHNKLRHPDFIYNAIRIYAEYITLKFGLTDPNYDPYQTIHLQRVDMEGLALGIMGSQLNYLPYIEHEMESVWLIYNSVDYRLARKAYDVAILNKEKKVH